MAEIMHQINQSTICSVLFLVCMSKSQKGKHYEKRTKKLNKLKCFEIFISHFNHTPTYFAMFTASRQTYSSTTTTKTNTKTRDLIISNSFNQYTHLIKPER